jgi:L-asparaginase
MASGQASVVILGTGGTIAGTAAHAADNVGYRSARRSVQALVAAVPALRELPIEAEQVAQVDSKDMDAEVWRALAGRAQAHLARDDVAGVVVTHGTDTLEETAWLLHRVLRTAKPVVLTAAMRPATSLQADGPQNLLDAVTVARDGRLAAVVVAIGGRVFAAAEVRKVHSYRLDAFDAGDAGPVALVEEGQVRVLRDPPEATGLGAGLLDAPEWPLVEVVTSHAGAGPLVVDALVAAGVDGIAVAATGNGSVHVRIEAALQRARAQGVHVLRASRCAAGGIVGTAPSPWPSAGTLTPVQARVELILRLLQRAQAQP